ncbi:hypothetical protein HBH56_214360 [Parastagonospora nodorum]|uniref:Major facilitator superfamily (MFS) profile domain-containing protein n=1 Tax=Phaeosphaeria nodorum (strain SN15 / ATCC MYA-4574 / FGSC 10173) TaxID=321614 RepID=A0A7U2F3N4_PHANO|nr:hypothetical protein HBH56_214360 [Parastagonospora nodorum]QRC97792.1 hypothetical protein JI435_151340 [Parastagonospora nodorum SN15]KAH3923152.1 hypothetical protein HBH54_216030 [Parastagonospora nodorum]KAH3941698.1 hypothetical protein HBH53_196070 [Parastagonospora nodorum]KAH3961035.1 hypothetical protein HBH51_185910 [Parastagonospora nodorum]
MLIKSIDTSNITNAFVSGMKEDLDLYGNEYNYIVVAWTIGYIIGQLPSNFILTRVPAHMWIPFQEVGWTVFTFALAGAKSYRALLGLRFVVELFEAGYWPALYYVLGSWYNKCVCPEQGRRCHEYCHFVAGELGKRNGILQSAVSIAPIFSGFLQAGIYNGLNDHTGLAGWRWLFGKLQEASDNYITNISLVINGVISMPVAIAAYFFLPDTPGTAKPNWIFTERDLHIARERMARAGRKPEGTPYTVKTIFEYLTNWKTLLFTLIFMVQPFGSQPFQAFVFWLKAHNKKGQSPVYTITQINTYPTIGNAFTAVYGLLCVWISDGPLKGRRWPVILFSNMIAIVIFALLAATPVMGPFSHRAPLYIVSSIGGSMVPLTLAWMAELLFDSAEQRAFTAASMNTLQYTFTAWIPLVWFQQVHQPYVTPGNHAAAVIAGLNLIIFTTIAMLARRERSIKVRAGSVSAEPDVVSDGSSDGDKVSRNVVLIHPKAVEVIGTAV